MTTVAPFPRDEDQRRLIAESLDSTLVVEAAAGTGKTTALVGRILALIERGRTTLPHILAVTFTDKAAGEMKLRLRQRLEQVRVAEEDPAVTSRLMDAIKELEAARIVTIHALCADLLRERPVAAGVDPLFDVVSEGEAQDLFEQAFELWFQRVLADPPEGVRRWLRRGSSFGSPRDGLRRAAWSLTQRRDYSRGWERRPFDRASAIDSVIAAMAELGKLADQAFRDDDFLGYNLREVNDWVSELGHKEAVRERDYDGVEAELHAIRRRFRWHYRGFGRAFGPDLSRDEAVARRDAVVSRLDGLLEDLDADLAPCLEHALWPVVDAYEDLKARAGKLDFFDLQSRVEEMLRRDPDVRQDLQERFSHILVDEFQDTDPLQARIILLLAASDPSIDDPDQVRVAPGKLFLVGDPKQSIYRFRRADVALYERLKTRLLDDGAVLVRLSVSFRGDPRIQHAVNLAFEPLMTGGTQATYVPLEPYREAIEERPAVIALPVPHPYSQWGRIAKWQIDVSLADAVGAFVDWLVHESKWMVTDGGATPVPVAPHHVCLLFRRFQSFDRTVTDAYAQALERRHIPHVLVGGRSFHEREEVLAVRNALVATEWPDDELSVFATLRGPLFAVGDDALLAWRGRGLSLHPLLPPQPGEDPPILQEVRGALDVLRDLHRQRNRRPFAATVTALLEATRAHAGLAIWSGGEQALANVLRLTEIARQAEAEGAISFRSFVNRVLAAADRGEGTEAPVVEEGTEGVRIMTVHKAKGLEFPVVILCDISARATSTRPSRYVDPDQGLWFEPLAGCVPRELLDRKDEVLARDHEEADRLLYVAATRARDVLVLPAIGDGPDDAAPGDACWTDAMFPVIYPPATARNEGRPAPGCPAFGADTVRSRPAKARPPWPTLRPGLHATEAGSPIVWWDPDVLILDPPELTGLRRERILVEDEGGRAARESSTNHAAWSDARDAAIASGARPSRLVRTPTDLGALAVPPTGPPLEVPGGREPGDAPDTADAAVLRELADINAAITVATTTRALSRRASSRRLGTLVHEVLRDVAFGASSAAAAASVSWHGRRMGASDEERAQASEAVAAALDHPLLRAAATSSQCRREVDLSITVLAWHIEGVADLAFMTDEGWTVVDFKTGLPTEASLRAYRIQVACYAAAIARATGQPTRGVLLLV